MGKVRGLVFVVVGCVLGSCHSSTRSPLVTDGSSERSDGERPDGHQDASPPDENHLDASHLDVPPDRPVIHTDMAAARDMPPDRMRDSGFDSARDAPGEHPHDAGVCPAGQTLCPASTAFGTPAACRDLENDPSNCAACYAACPGLTNGTATCMLHRCGLACNTGYHLCGSTCVIDSDTTNCGVCTTGYHVCGNGCVSNSSTASCGMSSCTPCVAPANATATCDGTTCGIACSSGYHACSGACAANTDPTACGASCTVCHVPTNGDATCDGTNCGIACHTGYHNCGGVCVSNTSVATCGTLCTPCTTPANGSPTCDGTSCGISCGTGYHACGGNTCASNSDPATCGSSCSPCTGGPTGSAATCNGTSCSFPCPTGTHLCSAANLCASDTDANHCGSSCTACAAPGPDPDDSTVHGAAACSSGQCVMTCSTAYHYCSSYFDSGSGTSYQKLCATNLDQAECGTYQGAPPDATNPVLTCTRSDTATCANLCGAQGWTIGVNTTNGLCKAN